MSTKAFLILPLLLPFFLVSPARGDDSSPRRDRIVVEALLRLENVPLTEPLTAAVHRHLQRLGNDPAQLKLIQKLDVTLPVERWVELISDWGETSESIVAIDLALAQGAANEVELILSNPNRSPQQSMLAKAVALSNRAEATSILKRMVVEETINSSTRIAAAIGLTRTPEGQNFLIELARADQLPSEATSVVGPELRNSTDEKIRTVANTLFPAPTDTLNLRPVSQLTQMAGDAQMGQLLFAGVATCNQCHQLKDLTSLSSKNVGPNLLEIGDKLSREAMFVAILNPSAGISHNYETYAAILESGTVVTGLKMSETEDAIVLRDAKGIDRTLATDELIELVKQPTSLMPENLAATTGEQGLVDLVEYLTTLRK
jgi:putative heme-binding domain-containing protein